MKNLLFILLLLIAVQAEATDRYVQPSASGLCSQSNTLYNPATNTCGSGTSTVYIASSQGNLNTALAQTNAGDRLFFRAGTYNWKIDTNAFPMHSGTSYNNAPVFAAYSSSGNCSSSCELVTFTSNDGLGIVNLATGAATATLGYVIFDGLNFNGQAINSPSNSNWVVSYGNSGGSQFPHHTRFQYGRVYSNGANFSPTVNNSGGGFYVDGDNNEFLYMEVDHNAENALNTGAANGPYGYYMHGGTGNLIEHNNIHNNGAFGIHGYSSTNTGVTNHTYRYNTIYNNGNGPLHAGSGILLSSGSGNAAYGNIIYSNDVGIRVDYSCTNCLVYNNSVYSNTNYGLEVHNTGTGPLVTNNIFSTNAVNIQNDGGSSPTYTTNLCSGAATGCAFVETAATTFVTPGTNFTIKAGSAALDSGTTLPSPYATDLLNITRPQGSAFDLGALELIGAGAPTPIVAIAQPSGCTGNSTACTVTASVVNVTGSSSISGGTVAWTCNRCTVTSGSATGTSTWVMPSVTLKSGLNTITVTHTTGAGGQGSDTITITYAPTFTGNALVAAYAFDEGSGSSATDSSGNSNTGTLIASPTWVAPGRYGSALQFNGTSQYIDVNDSNTLDLTQSFTISLWVSPTATSTNYSALVNKNASPLLSPYRLLATVAGECGTGGIAGFSNSDGSLAHEDSACSATPLQLNVWTHLAFTYNGTTLTLYKNGVSVATHSHIGYLEPSPRTLQIASSEFNEYFTGLIDEVRIYNFALPLTGGANTVFGAGCNRADNTAIATASVIGNANCPITPLAPPIAFKIGSAASNLKLGASSSGIKIGGVPQ